MRQARSTAAGLLMTFAIAGNAFAWGQKGHQIIARIAEQNLTAETSATVKQILGGRTLVDITMWADQARNTDEYRYTAPYHYVNIPKGAVKIDLVRDGGEKGCVVLAIPKYGKIIADEKASKRERLDALRFVTHFIGDLHCPMHASYAEDRGGNDVRVHFGDQTPNLHSIWDTWILESRKLEMPRYVADLTIQSKPGGPLAGEFLVLDKTDAYNSPIQWADESLEAMLANCYQFKPDEDLSLTYTERAIPIVNSRLYRAGIRLAAFLNATLKPSPNDLLPATESKPTTATTAAAPAPAMTQAK